MDSDDWIPRHPRVLALFRQALTSDCYTFALGTLVAAVVILKTSYFDNSPADSVVTSTCTLNSSARTILS